MTTILDEHLSNLRRALLKLPTTGEAGFEGLLAAMLTEISGVPFRLAASGSQFGVDGKPAYETDGVCFEGKRNDGRIPREDVLTKLADLTIGDNGHVDLWILGATTPAGSQLADDVRELGDKVGIATLILDWIDNSLPLLGVALGMAEAPATGFLSKHLGEAELAKRAGSALNAIRHEKAYASQAERIRTSLLDATIGTGLAGRANREWLADVFSSRSNARRALGSRYVLVTSLNTVERAAPAAWITSLLTGKPELESWKSYLAMKGQANPG